MSAGAAKPRSQTARPNQGVYLSDEAAAKVFAEVAASRKPLNEGVARTLTPKEWGPLASRAAEGKEAEPFLAKMPDQGRADRLRALIADAVEQRQADEDDQSNIVDHWPVPDDAMFYGIIGELVRKADPHTEADPVAVMVQTLVGFCNSVGRGPHWVVSATRHYLSFFLMLVGLTAMGRKGESENVARHFLNWLDEDWTNNRIVEGLSTGEGLIHAVRDPIVKVNKKGETETDPGEPDKRLLLVESEMGRVLNVMNRENATLSGVLRQAWDCRQTLRIMTRQSPAKATGTLVSLIGHITQFELNHLLKANEIHNGAANRFLWVCTRKSKDLPDGGDFFAEDWTSLRVRFGVAHERARRIGLMRFDDETKVAWRQYYAELGEVRPGAQGSILARAQPQVKRLACAYALTDGEDTVRLPHMEAALALWRYSEATARFVFGDSLGDPKAEKLFNAIKASPDGISQSAITKEVFGNNIDKEARDKLLEKLLNMRLIHRVGGSGPGKQGRTPVIWHAGAAPRKNTKEATLTSGIGA